MFKLNCDCGGDLAYARFNPHNLPSFPGILCLCCGRSFNSTGEVFYVETVFKCLYRSSPS